MQGWVMSNPRAGRGVTSSRWGHQGNGCTANISCAFNNSMRSCELSAPSAPPTAPSKNSSNFFSFSADFWFFLLSSMLFSGSHKKKIS